MRTRVVLCVAALVGALLPVAPARSAPGHEVVVSGLNNPRQISFGPGKKTLVVAEAGRGGPRCNDFGCWGRTGSVSVVPRPGRTTGARPQRAVRGLLSVAGPNGEFAVGSDGACAYDRAIKIAMTFAPREGVPGRLPARQLGKLLSADRAGNVRIQANVTAVERDRDPDGQGFDSNPYSVLCLRNRQIVADAAGNDLIEVRGKRARLLTVFLDHNGVDSVPTSITLGGDGFIYVGELAGEKPNVARVWKLTRSGRVVDWIGGFTTVHGVSVKRDGTMYVSELFGGPEGIGQITKVTPSGRRFHRFVPAPAGILAHWNRVYVAAWSISDADGADLGGFQLEPGQIWRLRW